MKLRVTLSDAIGFGLFTVTAVYAIEYFIEGTATQWDAIKAGAMAFCFEGAKIALWRRGWTRHNPLFLVVSIPFFLISFIAAGGSAMIYLGRGTSQTLEGNLAYQLTKKSLDETDAQIQLLQKRLDIISSDPNAATATLRSQIGQLITTRDGLSDKLLNQASKVQSEGKIYSSDQVMATFALLLGVDKGKLELIYMLARAILLELGAMASTVPTTKLFGKGHINPRYIKEPKMSLAHIADGHSGRTLCNLVLKNHEDALGYVPVCQTCLRNFLGGANDTKG